MAGSVRKQSGRFDGYGLAIAVSLLLHGILVAWVVWGWEFSSEPQHRVVPKYVEAKLVTLKPKAEKKTAAKNKPNVVNLAEKRKQQARREKEKQRKLAEQKRRKAEKLAREKQLERERELAEKKAAEKKAADAERRRKQLEAEKQARLAEQAEQERLQRESEFADALAEEEAMLQAEEEAAQAQSYIAHIAALIEQHWSRPPSARRGMQCELSIQLIPTGEVINVSVVKGSGNAAFDRSAEQAVKKAGRFEVLKDVPPAIFDKYFRQLRLRFNPQDLRL